LEEEKKSLAITIKALPDFPDITNEEKFKRIKHDNPKEFFKSIGYIPKRKKFNGIEAPNL
jgi:hypothetical protein